MCKVTLLAFFFPCGGSSCPPPLARPSCGCFSWCQMKVRSAEYGAFFTGESTAATFCSCINKTESTSHRLPGNIRAMTTLPEERKKKKKKTPRRVISINAPTGREPAAFVMSVCLFVLQNWGGGKDSKRKKKAKQTSSPASFSSKVTEEYPLGRSGGGGGLVTHFSFTAVRSDNEDGRRKQ